MNQLPHGVQQVQVLHRPRSKAPAIKRVLVLPELNLGLIDRNTFLRRFRQKVDDFHHLRNVFNIRVVIRYTAFLEGLEYILQKKVVPQQSWDRAIDEVVNILPVGCWIAQTFLPSARPHYTPHPLTLRNVANLGFLVSSS